MVTFELNLLKFRIAVGDAHLKTYRNAMYTENIQNQLISIQRQCS